jgi:hypothetical protein
LLLKEIGKDKLRQEPESSKIIKVIEEAEASFIDSSLADRFERIENCLDVINKRDLKGIYEVCFSRFSAYPLKTN